jgi:hypothetical protein
MTMSKAIYDAVLLLVEQLTPNERKTLAAQLTDPGAHTALTPEDWQSRFKSLVSGAAVVGRFSDRREDWYSDDGR